MSELPKHTLDFFTRVAPWEILTVAQLSQFVSTARLVYLNDDFNDLLEEQRQAGNGLLLIQSGEFEVVAGSTQEAAGQRFISEAEYVLLPAVKQTEGAGLPMPTESVVKVHTPGLVYCLNLQATAHLMAQDKTIQRFFDALARSRVQDDDIYPGTDWQEARLARLCQRDLAIVTKQDSVAACARVMAQKQVSSVLVCEQGKLVGILTDKDLRCRVLAQGTSPDIPAAQIMTPSPAVASPDQDWLDAVCLMSEKGFSHVPIVDAAHQPVGILTKSDVINQQKSNIAWLIKSLAKANNLYELMQLAWQIPHYIRFNMQGKHGFATVGQWLARATDVMTRRLLQFYCNEHGQPPFDWCWLVYGSQARKDQLLTSDQDNGLLLAQTPDPDQAQYFKGLAEYVCNGLSKCGIALCSGNIMASNADLRKNLEQAVEEARLCVTEPSNERLLTFNIFLDVRMVAGSDALFEALQSQRSQLFKKPLFLAALAREVNRCEVPLNLFQRFVFAGQETGEFINLKVQAVAVINSIVRLYSLSMGLKQASTPERLAALSESGLLSARDCRNLNSIWLFLNELRLNSQLRQAKPDNLVDIAQLTPMEKYQLKKAFQSIKRAQSALLVKFSSGLGG